ncbi:MAG: PrsW family intramembrane metalloprotease [Gemmatimonadota bacterium]
MDARLTAQTDSPQADLPPAPPAAPPARTRWWTGRRKAVATFGVLTFLLIALETGTVGFAVGLLLATLPVPLYVAVALWLDRFEAEPRGLLVRAFVWGAAGAVFFSMLVNSFFEISLAGTLGEEAAGLAGSVISAPLVEELTKALVLFVLFFRHRDEFDNVTDGIVYAAMVGLGFAMTENVLYYGNALAEGIDSSLGTFVVRGMLSPFAHPFFTAMTGIGLGIARERNRGAIRFFSPVLGLCAAMLLHATWNLAASTDAFFAVYFLVMVPIFWGVVGLVVWSLRREGRLIRAHLAPFVETGAIDAAELDHMCTVRGRMRASAGSLRRGGLRAWRAHRELHQAVSELAFHRWRVGRGITRGAELDAAREGELVARIGALRGAAAA